MKKIVVIGGGTGVFTVLTGLKDYPYHLAAVVSMADNGGSTGMLREEFGVLPPGDIRRALVALSRTDNKIMSELFNYRFSEGTGLKGHSMGNLLLTALERITGSFPKALKQANKILNVKGEVIPVTLESTHLCAELEDGEVIRGETNIDIPQHDGHLRVKRIFLDPEVSANPDAVRAIESADFIVLGPGDLYTSILPNLKVNGITEAVQRSRAKKIYVVNIMTKFGETNAYKVSDFIHAMEKEVGEGTINYAVVNTQVPAANLLARYQVEKDEVVKFDSENIPADRMKIVTGKFLRRGQFLRHDPAKLAETLSQIVDGKN
jgi:uncharacterized cofD-like protein